MPPPPEPLDLVRPLLRARQVREFTEQPLSEEQLFAITQVARWSGSSRNQQPWRFLVIRDRATLMAIHDASLPQTRALRTATAGIAISLPADPDRLVSDAYDDGRAAERILIAATWLGLGAAVTWIRRDVHEVVRAVLGLPSDRMVRTVMALGHPTEAAQAPKSPPGRARAPRSELIVDVPSRS